MTRFPSKAVLLAVVLLGSGCLSTSTETVEPEYEVQTPKSIAADQLEWPSFGHHQSDSELDLPEPLQNKTTRDDVNVTLIERELERKLNQYRELNSADKLVVDPRLARIARHHSYDMATREFFNHTNPDGDTYGDRLEQHGYRCNGGGENIQVLIWNYPEQGSESDVAQSLLEGFMGSPQHNTGMINPKYTTVGIGIYVTEDGWTYVTMNLCDADVNEKPS